MKARLSKKRFPGPKRVNAYDWMDEDTRELFRLLEEHDVRYLIVGGVAVNYHGYPRNTVDTDIFYEPSPDNARRLFEALREFWGGSVPAVQTTRSSWKTACFSSSVEHPTASIS